MKEEQESDNGYFICFMLGLVIAIPIIFGIQYFCGEFDDDNELGGAICKEQYNSSFDYYDGEVLHCVAGEHYDGIRVSLNGAMK